MRMTIKIVQIGIDPTIYRATNKEIALMGLIVDSAMDGKNKIIIPKILKNMNVLRMLIVKTR